MQAASIPHPARFVVVPFPSVSLLVAAAPSWFHHCVPCAAGHKAKNLVPDAGMRATQVGLKVREIQLQLPQARVVYCSATGASGELMSLDDCKSR